MREVDILINMLRSYDYIVEDVKYENHIYIRKENVDFSFRLNYGVIERSPLILILDEIETVFNSKLRLVNKNT